MKTDTIKPVATKVKIIILVVVLVVSSLFVSSYFITGNSFAWVYALSGLFSKGETAKIEIRTRGIFQNNKDNMEFELNSTLYLMPGETIPVTSSNRLIPSEEEVNSLYRITYWAHEDSEAQVKALELSDNIIESKGLIKSISNYQDKKVQVSYFGRCDAVDPVDLGQLLLTCATDDFDMNSEIKLHAEVTFCQSNPSAFQDIYEIDDAEMHNYSSLFQPKGEVKNE